jgi:hypothetical protein
LPRRSGEASFIDRRSGVDVGEISCMHIAPLALALVLLVAAGPANAAPQLRASRPPRTSGPLEPVADPCYSETVRGDGRVYVRTHGCFFLFAFDRLSETDLLRAYGVAWLQFTLDTQNGLCADRLSLALDFPQGTTIEGFTPSEPIAGRPNRQVRVHLDVTAGGNALEDASISQKLIVLPQRLDARVSTTSVFVAWRGHSDSKVAIAGGAEISWNELTPLDRIEARVDDIQIGSC